MYVSMVQCSVWLGSGLRSNPDGIRNTNNRHVQELKVSTDEPPCCPLPAGRLHAPSTRLHNYTHCGRQAISRIIGGAEAVENEIPWMCAIMR